MATITGMTDQETRERNGYLTTTGRVTGRTHEIEIWFAVEPDSAGRTVYMLAGGRERSDWVRNVGQSPNVRFRVGGTTYHGSARIVGPDEAVDGRAREIVATKYAERDEAGGLNSWARMSLPVVIELEGRAG
ncbi:MAG TPA: nitroreductase/quinone reductase family protein [Thermomicrobiales bacterium]|nr:nitroreductase/quinone reductase family protein [Thermomicrobiales bacterium]